MWPSCGVAVRVRARCGDNRVFSRISRRTRLRLTRMVSVTRNRAQTLRCPSPVQGDRSRSLWIAASKASSVIAGLGLLSNQIEAVADASGWMSLVQGGQFRLLVVWGSKRMAMFPQVRTLKEAEIDLEVNSPYGVCGPRGMDPAAVKKIHAAMKAALFDPATHAVMERYNMPTLYLDSATYDVAAREQDKI